MATYSELLDFYSGTASAALKKRIRVAVLVAVDVIRTEATSTPNHANRMVWAKKVLDNYEVEADKMVWAALVQNRAATIAQIGAADDATVQVAVNAAVDLLAGV